MNTLILSLNNASFVSANPLHVLSRFISRSGSAKKKPLGDQNDCQPVPGIECEERAAGSWAYTDDREIIFNITSGGSYPMRGRF